MIYRSAGRACAAYADERLLLPHAIDRMALALLLAVAAVVLPLVGPDYLFDAILLPFLALSLAAIGLNILTGYAGQLSLGTAAFMAVGAFAAYNLNLRLPGLPLLATFALSGLVTAAFGLVFGLPSLRLKGFYLAVSTLAAQFFVQWALTKFRLVLERQLIGCHHRPAPRDRRRRVRLAGRALSPEPRRGDGADRARRPADPHPDRAQLDRRARQGRRRRRARRAGLPHQAHRLRDQLLLLRCRGVPVGLHLPADGRARGFDLDRSFQVLFIIIIGGLASIRGCFLGAAFMVVFPLLLSRTGDALLGGALDSGLQEIIAKMVVGSLIIAFLIAEPRGLVSLWSRLKAKLETWPFAY